MSPKPRPPAVEPLPFDLLDPARFSVETLAQSYRGSMEFLARSGTAFWLGMWALQWGPRWLAPELFGSFMKRFLAAEESAPGADMERAAEKITAAYPEARYPAILIAPPSGAAAVIARCLNAPLLPVNYGIGFPHYKGPLDPDDAVKHYESGLRIAERFLRKKNRPGFIVQEYDPLHGRFRVKWGAFLRFVYSSLPAAYQTFIRKTLDPGGRIVLIESRFSWRQYQAEDDFFFQIGSPGGIPDDEYIQSSKRLIDHHERAHREPKRYRLNLPDCALPEARYGTPTALRDATLEWGKANGKQVQVVRFSELEPIGRFAADLFVRASRKEGKRPVTLWVCSGSQFHAAAAFKGRVVPFWMPSSSFRDLKALKDYLSACPVDFQNALLSLEPSLGDTPDMAGIAKWKEALGEKVRPIVLGNSPGKHPLDFPAYFGFGPAFRFRVNSKGEGLDVWLDLKTDWDEAVQSLAAGAGTKTPVREAT